MSRFELAPPRRFILPAILLLLSERPGYGYGLVPASRSSTSVTSTGRRSTGPWPSWKRTGWSRRRPQSRRAGQAGGSTGSRRSGERVLRVWMGVIKDEHDYLGKVLRRYQATGTTDAVLAEVEGGWATASGRVVAGVVDVGGRPPDSRAPRRHGDRIRDDPASRRSGLAGRPAPGRPGPATLSGSGWSPSARSC